MIHFVNDSELRSFKIVHKLNYCFAGFFGGCCFQMLGEKNQNLLRLNDFK